MCVGGVLVLAYAAFHVCQIWSHLRGALAKVVRLFGVGPQENAEAGQKVLAGLMGSVRIVTCLSQDNLAKEE